MSKCDGTFRHCQRNILNLKQGYDISILCPRRSFTSTPKRRDIWIKLFSEPSQGFLPQSPFLTLVSGSQFRASSNPQILVRKRRHFLVCAPLPSSHFGRFLHHPPFPAYPQPLVGLNPHPLLFTSSSGEAERFTPCG